MDSRQRSWPRIWLMTDERMGDRLWEAIERLQRGAGVVLRHYSLPPEAREELARRLAVMARLRDLTLSIAGDVELARRCGAQIVHNPIGDAGELPFSRAVHNAEEARGANAEGAALVFVSPVFPTRSHANAAALGVEQAAGIAMAAGVPAIALGGVNAENFAELDRTGFYGWAGIDAWLHD
jgi:thiamine-phosphate pyrophosphorylase